MIYLIVNDHAKTGGGSKVEKIKAFLKKQAQQKRVKVAEFFTVLPTENAGDATKYVRAICRRGESKSL